MDGSTGTNIITSIVFDTCCKSSCIRSLVTCCICYVTYYIIDDSFVYYFVGYSCSMVELPWNTSR